MEATRRDYWVGEFFDGEIVIFAPEFQRAEEKEWVYLWSHSTGKVEPYLKHMARKAIRKPQDDSKAEEILQYFVEQRRIVNEKAEAERAQRAKEIAEREAQKARELEERHRAKVEGLGLPWRGLRKSKKRPLRVTHCWSCKGHLDNSVDVECNTCGWILCRCGACGCGRA